MAGTRYYVILNANAGTALATGVTPESLADMFFTNGLEAEIDARSDIPLSERIADAKKSGADTVVAAGGDGTVTALAEALLDVPQNLAILPLGTVNALAKDLLVPLDIPAAIAAMANGTTREIDVGEVNGRVFLHKVVVGVIPALAAGREKIRGRRELGAKIGFMRYLFRRLARARRMAVAIESTTGERRVERVQSLAVASNAYDEGLGQFFSRHALDQGTLTLYVLKRLKPADFFRLSFGMLLGRWQDYDALSTESIDGVTITSHKPLLKVMLDGEVETLHTPLVFSIRPRALSVVVPASADQAVEAA
jgi:diacylglycerol kinase family enzyme